MARIPIIRWVALALAASVVFVTTDARAGVHTYTSSFAERSESITGAGFGDDGEMGHVWTYLPEGPPPPADAVPLYELYNPESGRHEFSADPTWVNQDARFIGYRVERVLGFVLVTANCTNPDTSRYETLYKLSAVDAGPDRVLSVSRTVAGYEFAQCVAQVPKAGAANVVPLYSLIDPAEVAACPAGKKCIPCFDLACDGDGDWYASYPCNGVITFAYDKEDDDGGKKACPDGYLGEVELSECDRPCSALWEDHARSYRIAGSAYATAQAEWAASLASIHPHRYEVSNGLDDDCDRGVDEAEQEYLPSDLEGVEREYPWIRMKTTIHDPAAATGVRMEARAYRLADFESLRQVFKNEPPIGAVPCATSTLITAPVVEALLPACAGDTAGPVAQSTATNVVELVLLDGLGHRYWSVDNAGQLSVVVAHRPADELLADPFIQASHPATSQSTERALTHAQFVNRALFEWNLSQHEGQAGFQAIPGRAWPTGTRYGADYGERWCSEFASYVLGEVSSMGPGCTAVPCFWEFYERQSWFGVGDSPEGYAPLQNGQLGRDALRSGVVEPGDYLAMDHGLTGSHSGLFLAFNTSQSVVWRVGGNESAGRLCSPTLHECGTSAVFVWVDGVDRAVDDDYFHDMVGLNWWMRRR